MLGFVLLRARAHRLLLAAALLTIALTTAVVATLTAYASTIGDAALRHSLAAPDNVSAAALVVKADVPPSGGREAAERAVREGARETFDGLPVTVRTLLRSGPYALPRSVRPATERSDNPDLTHFATLDPAQVRLTEGRLPRRTSGGGAGPIEVALPQSAAGPLGLRPGDRLTLTDRLDGPAARVTITGLYRPADPAAPYWRIDELRGRGVQTRAFTTYGPLLADPAVLTGGRVSTGPAAWVATADFSALTADRIDDLRTSAVNGTAALRKAPALRGITAATSSLPEVLDRLERFLVVSRSTLLIVVLLLVVLAGCALLLVARRLSAERTGETRLLRARGGSTGGITRLAALEALLLALPAALCAPLLAGPLTRLLVEHGALARIGLDLDTSAGQKAVWLVSVTVALGCALAVTVPAPGAGAFTVRRARSLPAPLRAGADLGLVALAAVAYWQLERRTTGTVSGTRTGSLGIDPLLVAAPALALLAGTVLTLRLLPPLARLGERWAARGRGLSGAMAGWQLGRRPAGGTGPVLLLVLAVALGMLAIGEGASRNRSQDDQADFRAGTEVRVVQDGAAGPARSTAYEALDGVRSVAPARRVSLALPAGRTGTVLALDTRAAADGLLLRGDLAAERAGILPSRLRPRSERAGVRLPAGATAVRLTVRLRSDLAEGTPVGVTVTVEDRHGVPHSVPAGTVRADGRPHVLTANLTDILGPAGLPGTAAERKPSAGREPAAEPGAAGQQTAAAKSGAASGHTSAGNPGTAHEHASAGNPGTAGERAEKAGAEPTAGLGTTTARTSTPQRATDRLLFTALLLDPVRTADGPERYTLTFRGLASVAASGPERAVSLPSGWTARAHSADGSDTRSRPRVERSPAEGVTVRFGTGRPEDGPLSVTPPTLRLAVEQPDRPAVSGIATDRFLASTGLAGPGQTFDVRFGRETVPVRIVGTVRELPTTGSGDARDGRARDGGALFVDLGSVNRYLQDRYAERVAPDEWWLHTAPHRAATVAAVVRRLPDVEPSQVVVRDEVAEQLRDDPFGAGPEAAFAATAAVAAVLAALGFAVSTAGSLRERAAEFAVLRALGAQRRRTARQVALEQGVLVTLALAVGAALGTLLTRAVVPLIVLTPQATRPLPEVLVHVPLPRAALLLAAVALPPLAVTAVLALRRPHPAAALRRQGGE